MITPTKVAMLAPTVAALALALPACGGGGGTSAGKPEKERIEEFALKQAECMRRHGVNIPDPKPNGGLVIRSDMGNSEQVARAMRACEKEVGKPPTPQLSANDEREFRDAALKHARCMREHGVDMPDPKFGPNGTVQIDIQPGAEPGGEAFKAAAEKCQKLLGNAGVIGAGPPE